jgi:hypothetical protein
VYNNPKYLLLGLNLQLSLDIIQIRLTPNYSIMPHGKVIWPQFTVRKYN